MPAPINRAKAAKSKARKAKASSGPSSQGYVNEIDDADGWTPIVTILCSAFKLPDLNTRKGLKKTHANFDTIYETLDREYQRNLNNERIRGGIVAIFSKMCHDAVLRNKLFERGVLSKLLPLLDIDSTRHMALRALTNITHHGGTQIRASIASDAHVLTSLVARFPEDPIICDLSVSVLSHTVLTCTEGPEDEPAFPAILKKLDMAKILNTGIHCMTQTFSNGSSIEHGTNLLASSALHGHHAYKDAPEAAKILVAGMRSPDWGLRCISLGGLQRLHKPGSEEDLHRLDPNSVMAIRGRIPLHVNDVLMSYGPTRCELFRTMQAKVDYMRAMTNFPQDRNLYSLGLKLSQSILSTEFSIWDGFFQFQNPQTGQWEGADLGLPFNRWTDCLPLCAKALREKGLEADRDAANVLDLKFLILRGRTDEAADLGREGLKRNPNFAYYYYAISIAADRTNGLRAAKQGMKCKDITPFIKFQLMHRAVDHAAELGLETLQFSPGIGDAKWELGTSLLRSALEDSKKFMEDAPPDNRYMKLIVYWYVLLTILISEDISLDLHEIKRAQERLKIAEDVAKLLNAGPPNTMHRRTYQTVVKLFKESMEKYGELFKRQAEERELPAVAPPSDKNTIEDDLAAWLDNLQLEEGEASDDENHGGHDHCHRRDMNRHIHEIAYTKDPADRAALYRCSYCGNPSAGLKKCSGCEKARYCDGSCQKAHWKEHKRQCKT
ncbi:hypothetical protein BKA70DRAFT_1107218 [Coprinopsis sp. MPI-PUGE-AT-0042]|nr:hypothetical protein BKA70DRAFT_1107218 [Coprinopsis sp. MPI-PUGE-AT-0042]